ncbi:uncharacterized protein LOC110728891 [Chenopodium quinoa]|nr:uncharacterized protein LOC110728891 [Chenopodium quinoa]
MGMHLVVVAAFHLSRGAGAGAGAGAGLTTPRIAANLIWPFLFKLCLSVKVSPQDLVCSTRFLLFQIAQIFSGVDNTNNTSNSRWDRTLRLVRERVAVARHSPRSLPHDDEESLPRFCLLFSHFALSFFLSLFLSLSLSLNFSSSHFLNNLKFSDTPHSLFPSSSFSLFRSQVLNFSLFSLVLTPQRLKAVKPQTLKVIMDADVQQLSSEEEEIDSTTQDKGNGKNQKTSSGKPRVILTGKKRQRRLSSGVWVNFDFLDEPDKMVI